MNIKPLFLISALAASAVAPAQVGIDGLLGSEWSGVTVTSIAYDSGAPSGNFGSPSATTNGAPYELRLRADANYVYVLANTTGTGSAGDFSNLYFRTDTGSLIGFEVTNNRAFVPGVPGYQDISSLAALGTVTGGIEVALPWSLFTDDSSGVGTLPANRVSATNPNLYLSLSQSFGYSVVGGVNNFGPNRLGVVNYNSAVPEPASMAVLGVGLAALRRRRKSK